jgi:hypothetical protein
MLFGFVLSAGCQDYLISTPSEKGQLQTALAVEHSLDVIDTFVVVYLSNMIGLGVL